MAKKSTQSIENAPVIAVAGPEVFLKRQALQSIVETVLGDGDRAMAMAEYDGSSAGVELAAVLDDVRTLPFLAKRRLVIVRDADSFVTRYRAELEKYVDDPSDNGVLVLECKTFPATTRLYKRIAAVGQVIKCEAPKPREVGAWLTDRCKTAHGCKLDANAATLLVDLVGGELGLLDAELQKLVLYVSPRDRVTQADVEALVGSTREEQVWGILTAVAAGDERAALSLWEDVWQTDRAASARALAGVAFTVRRMLNAKRALEQGASMRDAGRILMRWGDDAKLRAELAAFSTDQLEGMLCQLLEADIASKTGTGSVHSLIEAFIIRNSRRPQPRRATG